MRWWLALLEHYGPRRIPTQLEQRLPIVTYSDGEGGDAGVGISIYRQGWRPRAAYTEVHREIRGLWNHQAQQVQHQQEFQDIYCIEAVGPLLVLELWGEELRDALWLHFIDNTAAQQTIVKGSSSVWSGDLIAGWTWARISEVGAMLWLDRVCSKSNPIDGVSRGRFEGPWDRVLRVGFPAGLLADLARYRLEYGS